MDEKDFKLEDIINKHKEEAVNNKESAADNALSDSASTEKASQFNDGIADISFNGIGSEPSETPEIPFEAKEIDPVSDSDPIIPASERLRIDISDVTNAQTKTTDNVRRAKSYISEEEDIKLVSDRNGASAKKHKKKKSKKPKVNNSIFGGLIIISLILTASIVLAYSGISLGMEYLGIGKNSNDITFNIPEGATADEVIKLLQDNDIIKQPKLFSVVMKMKKLDFYPGDITLKPSMSYSQIIDELAVNRETRETVSVTFPEGITLRDAAQLLEDNKVCLKKDFLFQFNKSQDFEFEKLIEDTDQMFYKREGYFFPDTYEFYLDDDAYNVSRIIKEHFAEKFTASMQSKMRQSGMTLNELITLASMVQREAGTVKDMPIVASVFLNRLDDPATFPSLESDATGNYIKNVIKKEADTNVSIKFFTEGYDTYNCKGLPAGAICNPGLDAINAVLNPEETEYYYFCNNLDTGKAYYAKTLEEHEKNLVKAGLVEAE